MRRQRVRFLLTFLAGIAAAVLATSLSSVLSSVAATRYEDLALFTNVLSLVRSNYVEPVEESELVKGAVRAMPRPPSRHPPESRPRGSAEPRRAA